MTYFPDGSPYVYLSADVEMINVGWLGVGHEFAVGSVPEVVLDHLFDLAEKMTNLTRGVHNCEFCDEESPIRISRSPNSTAIWLGMSEIHVETPDGTVYAAPSLIIHYIISHLYLPPADFMDALGRR